MPRLAIWYAASEPAKPAPITLMYDDWDNILIPPKTSLGSPKTHFPDKGESPYPNLSNFNTWLS